MILVFKDSETEKILKKEYTKLLPTSLHKIAARKLLMMLAAEKVDDLKIPPGNRLEKLSGKRNGYYSIRINDAYRICFKEKDNMLIDVEIVNYH